jgi:hypothetical protein
MYCEPNIKEIRWKNLRSPLKSAHCPHTDHLSNFQHDPWVNLGQICVAHTILWRAANIWRAKNDPLRTLCVLTSSLLEEFPVLALLESPRVVLGSSKVPLEFGEAHAELGSGTRFGDESMDNLIVEVQHLIKIQIKR